jgi:hypothetical protein
MKVSIKLAGLLVVIGTFVFTGCHKKNNGMPNTNNKMGANNNTNTGNKGKITANNSDFMANLSGSDEVPNVKTDASGMAYFKMNNDSSKLMYTVKLSNADSVTAAHIHYGVKGKNGPPVVWLYPGPNHQSKKVKNGTVNGKLKSGTINSSNLVGPMKGKSIKDLIHAIKHDSAYVNAHNKAHEDGFIRGAVKRSTGNANNNNMNNQGDTTGTH